MLALKSTYSKIVWLLDINKLNNNCAHLTDCLSGHFSAKQA